MLEEAGCAIVILDVYKRQPEVGLGVIPGFGGTQRLKRAVGARMSKELTYTGITMGAAEAEKIGLGNKVVPAEELMNEAMKTAELITAQAQLAVRQAKCSINIGGEIDLPAGLELESQAFGLCFDTEDQTIGMTAFVEKKAEKTFKSVSYTHLQGFG